MTRHLDPAFDHLRNTLRSNPAASEKEIANLIWDSSQRSPTMRHAIFAYWFKNNFKRFAVDVQEHATAIYEKHRKMRAQGKRAIKAIRGKLELALMDHLLPNGKLLRNASFGYLATLSGFFRDVSKLGKPNEIVGKKLTETDLRNLSQRNSRRKAA